MVARVLYGLCSFLAVLRVDDDFADAFRNRDQAIAANAASAPHLEFSVTKLGDGNGFLEAFREAQNIAGWLAADPHRAVSDQAECQLRLAQRRMVAFLARCWLEQDPLHGDSAFVGLERHEQGRMLLAGVGRANDATRSKADLEAARGIGRASWRERGVHDE